jgi:hypothetical protein
VDLNVTREAIEELLEYFVTAALGLTLKARIQSASELPPGHRGCLTNQDSKPRVWAAWHTNGGPVSACAAYSHPQALRIGAYVLWIEWWIANLEHHEGWWHCYPNRPREWIKGSGTQNNSPSS